jgi:hypothetical protein
MALEPTYMAWIPAPVRYDNTLCANAKLLYGEITSLCNKEGFCWAGNEYFAGLYEVGNETISRWISQLRRAGYVTVTLFPEKGNLRHIGIAEKINRSCAKTQEVLRKNARGIAQKRKPIYENDIINDKSNREGALAFLEREIPTRLEAEKMKYQQGIGPADLERFNADFESKVTIELAGNKLVWDANALLARFGTFARSWVNNNQNKAAQGGSQYNAIAEVIPTRNKLV